MAMVLLYVQVFCRSTVVLIFLFSFLGKVRRRETFQQTITNFAILPTWLNRPASLLFLLAEALIIVLLLLGGPFLLPGYLFATALLLIFCLSIISVLIRRISTTCSCFGPSNKPVSSIDLVRNTGFVACTVGGCFTLAPPGSGQMVLNIPEWGVIGLGALAFVFIWTQLDEVVRLFS
jgi:Methylamine utilisation protein MauE